MFAGATGQIIIGKVKCDNIVLVCTNCIMSLNQAVTNIIFDMIFTIHIFSVLHVP